MPAIPTDLLDRIRALEDRLRALEGRAQTRPAMDQIMAGRVLIGEGGTLRVEAPNGQRVLATGEFATGKYGLITARSDGSGTALVIGSEDAEFGQMIRIFPRAGAQAMVMDDAEEDGWLGRPWIPHPLPQPLVGSTWPGTGSGSFDAVARSYSIRQHAHVLVFGYGYADGGGTTGEMRLTCNGNQVGPTVTMASGGFGTLDWRGSLGAGAWGDGLSWQVECRRTAGSGSVRGILLELVGVNS